MSRGISTSHVTPDAAERVPLSNEWSVLVDEWRPGPGERRGAGRPAGDRTAANPAAGAGGTARRGAPASAPARPSACAAVARPYSCAAVARVSATRYSRACASQAMRYASGRKPPAG